MEEYLAMAKDLGVSEAFDQRDPESDMLMREVTDAMKAKSDLDAKIIQTQTDFAIIAAAVQRSADDSGSGRRDVEDGSQHVDSQSDVDAGAIQSEHSNIGHEERPVRKKPTD